MKQIIDTYGNYMLDALIVVLLITLLFVGIHDENGNRGVFQMIGAKLPIDSVDYEGYTDYNSYQAESTRQAPEIYFQSGSLIRTGNNKLSDCIMAKDYAANMLQIKVISIKNPDDTDITSQCNQDTTEIMLNDPGVYTVTVSAKDDANRKSIKVIKIPVNE